MKTYKLLAILLLLGFGALNSYAQPSNDACANAIPIACNGTSSGSTVGATQDAPTFYCGYNPTQPDVWYSFVGTGDDITVTLCGSSFDTELGIFTGTCGSLTQIACNDDYCGLQSGVTFSSVSGTTYLIAITGYFGNTGPYSISVSCAAPAPDPCTSITDISPACPASATHSFTLAPGNGNSNFAWDPCWGGAPGNEQIYRFTPSVTASYSLDIISTNNYYLLWSYMPESNGCSNTYSWTCLAYSYPGGSYSYNDFGTLTGGVSYLVKVDAYNLDGNGGSFSIDCAFDPCATIFTANACGVDNSVSILSGVGGFNYYGGPYTTPGKENIYTFTPSVSGAYQITQSSNTTFNYIDYFFKPASGGCNNSGWTFIQDMYGSGTSFGSANMTAGITYYVMLDPEGTSAGNVIWRLECPQPSSCDAITDITPACPSTAVQTFSMAAGNGNGNLAWDPCFGFSPGKEQIFRFTPAVSGTYILNILSTNTAYALWSYMPESYGCTNQYNWSCLAYSYNGASYSYNQFGPLTAGVSYLIKIDNYYTNGNGGTFSISCPAPSPCDAITDITGCPVSAVQTFNLAAGNGDPNFVYSGSCFYYTPGHEKIYRFTAAITGVATLQVLSTDNYYAMYDYMAESTGCTSYPPYYYWNCMGYSYPGYNPSFNFNVTAGQSYLIKVDDYYTSGVNGTFEIICPQPPPPNDDCSGATPYTLTSGVPHTFTGTTAGATADGGYYSYPTVWEAVTLTAPSQLVVSFCGSTPALNTIWIILANTCPSVSFGDIFANSYTFDCGDGNGRIFYNCLAAGTYYIPILGGVLGNTAGPYSLTVTAVSTPTVGTATITPSLSCGPTGILTVAVDSYLGALQWQYESPVGAGNWTNIGGATFTPISLTANLLGAEDLTFGIRANVSVCSNSVNSNTVNYELNNPAPPTNGQGLVGCGSVNGIISATRNPLPNHDIRWYTAPSGGTLLGTGQTLSVNVSTSTSYYAATINNSTGCESQTRLKVDATVKTNPIINSVGSNSPVCVGQSINLTSSASNTAACAGGTFTVSVSGAGYGDETSWQLKDQNGGVLLSGGPYFTFGWSQTASVSSTNGPFKFSIETQGTFNDNTASWSVSAGGPAIVSGFISGGQLQNSSCFCSTGVVNCPSSGGGAYCTPTMSFGDGTDYISNVTLNTINNNSGWSSSGYSDFTAQSTTLTPGNTYTISISSGQWPSSEGVSAFIDWNQDGVFDLTTERLFTTAVTSTAFQVITRTFTVPMDAASGTTRLRAVLQYGANPVVACLTGFYLEGEDYTINIAGGVAAGYAWTGPNSFVSTAQNPSLTASQAAEGDYTVTYTSPNGCTASASTNVVVHEVPSIVSLQSATLNGGVATAFPPSPTFLVIPVFTEATSCDKVVNYNVVITGDPDPSETVGGITYSFSGATTGSGDGTGTGSTFGRAIPNGTTFITVNATNVCGSVSKQFRVIVTDNVPPVITPIQVSATNTNGGNCSSLVQVTQPSLGNGLFDNCPNANLVWVSRSDGRPQFDPYYAGTTTVTWQATDASGNISTATQDVVVNNIKPVITGLTAASGNVIFAGQSTTFTTTFTDEDGGGPHTIKFYRDKNDATPANTKTLAPVCYNSCTGISTYSVTSDPILFSTSEVVEPKVEVLDGCNQAADQVPGTSTFQYLAVAVAGSQFTTAGGHFTLQPGTYPSSYAGLGVNIGNVVKPGNGNNYKGQLEMNVHLPDNSNWRVHTDNGTNTDITWDYLVVSGCTLATFKGACRVNGQTGYKVLVQQADKNANTATSNFIRVKVTTNGGVLMFDTQPGLTEALTSGNGGAAAIVTALDGGSVTVHPNNGCVARIDGQVDDGLIQNIPNPFNGQTEIRFTVPEDGNYTLTVYNYLGQEVTTLFNGDASTGSLYSVTFDGSNLDAGIYTYTLRSANVSETRRMNLVK